MKRPILSLVTAFALTVGLSIVAAIPAVSTDAASAAGTQTAYAKQFVADSEGQQWFLDEIERILRDNQQTLNQLTGRSDLRIVKSIGLRDRAISGVMPKAIGELEELQYLFLSGNRLSGEIPAELFSLRKLKNIDLSGNGYEGEIPAGFGNMEGLEILSLRGNRYAGRVPDTITANTKLRFLDISSNKLSGAMPEFSNMSGLEYLAVSDNDWDAGSIPDLSALKRLESLSMRDSNRTGEIPDSLLALTSLQVLDLDTNSLEGEIPLGIGGLVNLQLLSLGGNKLSGTIPDVFGNLGKLTVLDLSRNRLRGIIPASFEIGKDTATGTDIEIYAEHNYLTGAKLAESSLISDNTGNFCDYESGTVQYQLTAPDAFCAIALSSETNIYKQLYNKPLSGSTPKPLLPADCYTVRVLDKYGNPIAGKAEARITSDGIYVKAAAEISKEDGIVIEVQIKDNDGSEYSTARLKITTEVSGGSSGGYAETKLTREAAPGKHESYINGYEDGTVRPDAALSREETAAMLRRVSGGSEARYQDSYNDVAASRWSAESIAWTTDAGLMNGYPDGSFRPASSITRAEFAAILVRLCGFDEAETAAFSDTDRHWAKGYIGAAAANGIMVGYADVTFKPDDPISRAEAVTAINRILGRTQEKEIRAELENPYVDLQPSHWAYWDILEASVEHEYSAGYGGSQ
jgi:hypothetical protein